MFWWMFRWFRCMNDILCKINKFTYQFQQYIHKNFFKISTKSLWYEIQPQLTTYNFKNNCNQKTVKDPFVKTSCYLFVEECGSCKSPVNFLVMMSKQGKEFIIVIVKIIHNNFFSKSLVLALLKLKWVDTFRYSFYWKWIFINFLKSVFFSPIF